MFKKSLLMTSLIVLLMLVFTVPTVASGTIVDSGACLDSVVLDGVTVCFLGFDDDGFGMTTWTYAVETDDLSGRDGTPQMSHVTFSVCLEDIDAVTPSSSYSTIAQYGGVLGRPGINYTVALGLDPTTGVSGIKFEDGEPQMENLEVDIFQFTQPTQVIPGTADVPLAVKSGPSGEIGTIMGPFCGQTSAVDLTQFSASGGLFSRILSWFGLR